MNTKLQLIRDLAGELAEVKYELGRLMSARADGGMTIDDVTELINDLRAGHLERAVSLIRRRFRCTAEEATGVISGGLRKVDG